MSEKSMTWESSKDHWRNFAQSKNRHIHIVQEAHKTLNRHDQKRKYLKHINVKVLSIYKTRSLLKDRRENKQTTKKQVTLKGKPIIIITDFSMGTLKVRKA